MTLYQIINFWLDFNAVVGMLVYASGGTDALIRFGQVMRNRFDESVNG